MYMYTISTMYMCDSSTCYVEKGLYCMGTASGLKDLLGVVSAAKLWPTC